MSRPTHEVADIVHQTGDSFWADLDAATVTKAKPCGLVELRLWWPWRNRCIRWHAECEGPWRSSRFSAPSARLPSFAAASFNLL